jgi:hypothetical protein
MKICGRCKETKPLNCFYKSKLTKDGLYAFCIPCASQSNKEYRQRNKEKILANQSEYRESNREKLKVKDKNYRDTNDKIIKARRVQERKRHKARIFAANAKRRASQSNATPPWLTDIHKAQIQWFYEAAKMMTETTGIVHHVDHIHPINGKNFVGLHVPWNLQCITAEENIKKRNYLFP